MPGTSHPLAQPRALRSPTALHSLPWILAPAQAELAAGQVHVWCAALDVPPGLLDQLAHTLSEEEMRRAERFVTPRHRDRFVAARGLLRTVLGHYLGIEPAGVRFSYGAHGKPALAEERGDELRFNLSHSHDLALLAVTRGREIGVDVEVISERVECEGIAPRFFSASENAALLALPIELRREGFFRCWTRKEAYIKALGEGLSHPLADFDVTLTPGAPARLLATHRNPAEAARWTLVDLTPAPGYAAALAVPSGFEVVGSLEGIHSLTDAE